MIVFVGIHYLPLEVNNDCVYVGIHYLPLEVHNDCICWYTLPATRGPQ